MNARRLLTSVLSVAILLLAAMAYASNVDPSWGGLYDNGDSDDAILFILGNVSAVEPAPLTAVDHGLAVVGEVGHADSAGSLSVSLSLSDSRSPPSS